MRALLIALSALLGGCVASHTSPSPAQRPPCPGHVVLVWRDEPLSCDVRPPQVLTVLGYTPDECDDHGGLRVDDRCVDVDY